MIIVMIKTTNVNTDVAAGKSVGKRKEKELTRTLKAR